LYQAPLVERLRRVVGQRLEFRAEVGDCGPVEFLEQRRDRGVGEFRRSRDSFVEVGD